jgi:Macrocin-O-methyltransferase (TylF)
MLSHQLKKLLFRPVAEHLYRGLSKRRPADAVYLPAFDRIFLQLSAFYLNGLCGDILEFGVLQGYTSKIIADRVKRFRLKKIRLHLFDSFEGLPETTSEDRQSYECVNGVWGKGTMSVPEGIERVIESKLRKKLGEERVFVVKGFFEKTLVKQIEEKKIAKVALIHLDCDLYSSSKYVLQTLFAHALIQEGTLLICDDWMTSFGNPNLNQRRAVKEILAQYPDWEFENYFNYGIGSQVFIAHNLAVSHGKKMYENSSGCPH